MKDKYKLQKCHYKDRINHKNIILKGGGDILISSHNLSIIQSTHKLPVHKIYELFARSVKAASPNLSSCDYTPPSMMEKRSIVNRHHCLPWAFSSPTLFSSNSHHQNNPHQGHRNSSQDVRHQYQKKLHHRRENNSKKYFVTLILNLVRKPSF